jgi:glycosyltransferase involved in cell wall biosynthesis
MRILFVAPRYHTNQLPFVRVLLERGHEVVFDVVRIGASEDHSLVRPNLMQTALGGRFRLGKLLGYRRRLKILEPDVVVVKGLPDPLSRPFAATAAISARLAGIPVVFYTQTPVHRPYSTRRDLTQRFLMGAFAATRYSPVEGDPRHRRVHRDYHYLPFAADVPIVDKSTWYRDGFVDILTIGKFVERKNHLLMIRAFSEVRQTLDLRLTIVGEVSSPSHEQHHAEVMEAIRANGIADSVTVMTNLGHGELLRTYAHHDLFVLPSRSEPAAVSILEAMACGLPVICSSTNGTRCYIEPGRNGLIFTSDDQRDLAQNVAAAAGDRNALRRMGEHSRTLATTVHDPERIYQAFMDIVSRRA